ncbi:solute carrier family 35 member E1 homolog isoform X1 [Cataglyphis hispanica]|uniref:solute carrier family 35 member E1 homolog isoform X1 n=1 Tax=Cataglyphis hispanica TaxID=1086592 RepID=UPI00217F7B59|nr:solute carrier family 35 member E1 homolog isoform X1 [Cataglyphis hispanica]
MIARSLCRINIMDDRRNNREMVTVLFLCLLWYVISSSSNVVGKMLLSEFPYPLTVTMVQLTSITLYSGPFFNLWGVRRYSSNITWSYYLRLIVPLALGKFLANVFSHVSIWKVPVSYAHTVKATMPLFTVALSRIILQEQQTWKVYLSLVPIVGGVAIATLTELSFNMIGLISALASTMAFSLQNIYSKKVLHETGIHHLWLLHILGRLALFMFLPIWGVYDLYSLIYEPVMRPSVEMSYYILGLLFLDGILNWFQNIIAFSVLSIVTPLTYAVASASKRIFVIAVTLLILGNPVTWLNIFGMTMAIFGVLCYNNAKYNQKMEKQKETILPKYYNPTQNGNSSSFMVNGFANKQHQSFAI